MHVYTYIYIYTPSIVFPFFVVIAILFISIFRVTERDHNSTLKTWSRLQGVPASQAYGEWIALNIYASSKSQAGRMA